MQRIVHKPRKDWKKIAHDNGFHFHSIYDMPYWDESAYYAFTLNQIENDLEVPTLELHQMVLDLVAEIYTSESMLHQLNIPEPFWPYIENSWKRQAFSLYGRMDFSYRGDGPAKLLELNYDTPTALYESAYFQWLWLEDNLKLGLIPDHSDQFNQIQECIIDQFTSLRSSLPIYFSCVKDNQEDIGTTLYLMDLALQANLDARFIDIQAIGFNGHTFVDESNKPISYCFKLYPWEFIFEDEFGLHTTTASTQWIEPVWKILISNKGILPLLWARYPNHPNLLPAYFDDGQTSSNNQGWVKKPIFSREGDNISISLDNGTVMETSGQYSKYKCVLQKFHPLPNFHGRFPVVGSWIVGGKAAGIGIREDKSLITKDTSCFVPHIICD